MVTAFAPYELGVEEPEATGPAGPEGDTDDADDADDAERVVRQVVAVASSRIPAGSIAHHRSDAVAPAVPGTPPGGPGDGISRARPCGAAATNRIADEVVRPCNPPRAFGST